MAHEKAGNTLQATALVHEAWLRLVANENPQFKNRAHFFAAAAEAMRRILIDRARHRRAVRHGGGQQRVELDQIDLPFVADDDQLLAVNEALDKLAAVQPLEAELVKLRYFVGLTHDETAEALGISVRTAKYYWAHARAWLFREISGSSWVAHLLRRCVQVVGAGDSGSSRSRILWEFAVGFCPNITCSLKYFSPSPHFEMVLCLMDAR